MKFRSMDLMSSMTKMFVDAKRERVEISPVTFPWTMRKSFVILLFSPDADVYIDDGFVCMINDLTFRKK